jgi:hypothetical protein
MILRAAETKTGGSGLEAACLPDANYLTSITAPAASSLDFAS